MSNDPEMQDIPYDDENQLEDVDIEITEDDLGRRIEDDEQPEEAEEEQSEEPEEVV